MRIAEASGNYYATVTNASGCQGSSDTIAVTASPLPAPVLSTNGPATFCQGDSVMHRYERFTHVAKHCNTLGQLERIVEDVLRTYSAH